MPKTKNTYVVGNARFDSYEKAASRAIDLSLLTGEAITITEHGQTGTYHITVRAQSEEAT